MIIKYDKQVNSGTNNNDKEKLNKKIIKLEMEIVNLQNILRSTKENWFLRNKFSLSLSYASFFLSAVALALSLVACL